MYLEIAYGLVFSYIWRFGLYDLLFSIVSHGVSIQCILYAHGHNNDQYVLTLYLLALMAYTLIYTKDTLLQSWLVICSSIIIYENYILIIYQLFLTPTLVARHYKVI